MNITHVRNTIVITVIIIFMLVFVLFFSVNPNSGMEMPQAENGVLDLENWDFNANGNVQLDGSWEFYPNVLLSPTDVQKWNEPHGYILVPSHWSNVETKSYMPDKGVGTYRLQIKIDPSSSLYGLKTTYIRNASKIYVNGKLVGMNGNPTASFEEGYESRNTPTMAFFPADEDRLEILIQVSNLDYYFGGIIQSMFLGTQTNIITQGSKASLLDMMGVAFLLISAIYYLGIYLKRPQDKSFLYFTLFCFAYTFIVLTSNERLFMQLITDIPYMLVIKIKMVVIGASICFMSLFIREISKGILPKRYIKVILTIIPLSFSSTIFFPTVVYSRIESILAVIGILAFFLIEFFIGKAIYTKKYGSLSRTTILLLFSVILVIIIQLLSMFLYLYSFINTNIVPVLTLLFFLLGIAAIFAEQYSRAYVELELMSNKLIEADKIKDEFLINTSHEFKTPLHGIINLAQVMIDQREAEASYKQSENLTYIISIATRLSTLVNDIIDFQSLQNRSLTFHNMVFDINAPIQVTFDVLKYMRKGEDVQLVNLVPEGKYYIHTDENRFKQIIVNLISNALKFTEKGSVEISANSREGFIVITITDTGIGIDEEIQKQLFTESQFSSELNYTDVRSTGIGLKISKLLASHMGGDLYLKWSEPNIGSAFELVLPIADAMQQREFLEQRESVVQQISTEPTSKSQKQKSLDFQTDKSELADQQAKTKILLVDDEASNIKVLQELFTKDRYETLIAYNGTSALELIQNHRDISLVLLDVMMPGITGYDVCKIIREEHPIYKLPILLLTVRNTSADITAGLEAGANDFLVKPFDAREMKARVKTLLQMREAVLNAIKIETVFLQSQIKPHFIYNVLSIIMSLCYSDGEKAGKLIGEFSNYLRLSFDLDPHHSMISLRRELAMVKSYIELEKARFGERLHVEIEVDDGVMDVPIPALIVQPIVENAVRHGLMTRVLGGTVKICVHVNEGELEIVIQDDGIGIAADHLSTILESDHSNGSVGFINVHKRLLNEYGHGLQIESVEGNGTKVTMNIPYRIQTTAQAGDGSC